MVTVTGAALKSYRRCRNRSGGSPFGATAGSGSGTRGLGCAEKRGGGRASAGAAAGMLSPPSSHL